MFKRKTQVLWITLLLLSVLLAGQTTMRAIGEDYLPCSEPDPFRPTFADVQLSPTRRAWAHSNAVFFTDCGLGQDNYTLIINTNEVTSFTWVAAGFVHYETLIWGEFSYDFDTREAVVINHPDHEPVNEHEPRPPIPNEEEQNGNIGASDDPPAPTTDTPEPPQAHKRKSWFWHLSVQ